MPFFVSNRDASFFNHINGELVNNVIDTTVDVYKVSIYETTENLYGESKQKRYYPAVSLPCLITNDDQVWDDDEFGSDMKQSVIFAFHRDSLKPTGLYPDIGDIIGYDESYYEINGIVENQLVAGQVDLNFSIVCSTHMTRLSKINIEERKFGTE